MLRHDVKTKANTNECPSYIRLEKSAQSWDGKILTYTTVEKYVAFSHKEQDFTVIFEGFIKPLNPDLWITQA